MGAIVGSAFGAAGQRCMALSVAVMVGDAGDWVKDIAEGASRLKVNVCFFHVQQRVYSLVAWGHGDEASTFVSAARGSRAVVAVCRSFVPMYVHRASQGLSFCRISRLLIELAESHELPKNIDDFPSGV